MTKNISLFQNKFSGENLFFTSDTHFFHEGIIKFCNRPFATVEEMNETLIQNWNETVPENGTVGKIFLILGNHDLKKAKQGFMKKFEHVSQQMSINVDGQKIILNHNPFLCYGGAYDGAWQLFGHVHSGPLSKRGKDLPRLSMLFPTQYDVGVDNNGFRPVSFNEVKAIIQKQQES
ncbi:MAG: metallophosphatase [Bacteroidales bacterium]|nr:metallophosphatase [Bacteroidales bacterium]